jgi:hypothetical protein
MREMFASKFNNNSMNVYQLNQQQLSNLNNSIDSNASLNSTSNSLLTAANTIFFNSPTSLSTNGSFSYQPLLLSPIQNGKDSNKSNSNSSFTANMINYHNNTNLASLNDTSTELDFDLHFTSNNSNQINSKEEDQGNDIIFNDDDIFIDKNDQEYLNEESFEAALNKNDDQVTNPTIDKKAQYNDKMKYSHLLRQSQLEKIVNVGNIMSKIVDYQNKNDVIGVNQNNNMSNNKNSNKIINTDSINIYSGDPNDNLESTNLNKNANFKYQTSESISPTSSHLVG